MRFNQPAGHLDEGESLVAACAREALEETAWHFTPTALVGVYQWPRPRGRHHLPALCLCRRTGRARDGTRARYRHPARGLDDARRDRGLRGPPSQPAGAAVRERLPGRPAFPARPDPTLRRFSWLRSWSACPAASIPRSPRCCSSAQGHEVIGLFMKNWEDDDTEEYLLLAPGSDRCRRRRRCDRHRPRSGEFLRRVQRTGVCRFPARIPGRAHAESGRAVQLRDQVQGLPRPRPAARRREDRHRPLRPGARVPRRMAVAQGRGRHQGPELFPVSPEPGRNWRRPCFRSAISTSARCARSPKRPACPTTRRRTRPASASSASGPSASFSPAICRSSRARFAVSTATR